MSEKRKKSSILSFFKKKKKTNQRIRQYQIKMKMSNPDDPQPIPLVQQETVNIK